MRKATVARTKPREVRDINQVIDDLLWPDVGMCLDLDQRRRAIACVLCCIPESDYIKLKDRVDDFVWFLPPVWTRAGCYPFPCTVRTKGWKGVRMRPQAHVLYFGARLERTALDIVVAIVAHELAHIFLQHSPYTRSPKEYDANEAAAWRLVSEWGFDQETKKWRTERKQRESRYENMLREPRGGDKFHHAVTIRSKHDTKPQLHDAPRRPRR